MIFFSIIKFSSSYFSWSHLKYNFPLNIPWIVKYNLQTEKVEHWFYFFFNITNSQISQKLPVLHLLITELQSSVPTYLPLKRKSAYTKLFSNSCAQKNHLETCKTADPWHLFSIDWFHASALELGKPPL